MSRTLFKENAFGILGLNARCSDHDVVRRAKEITNLLKIDEVPEYDIDLPFNVTERTEDKVKKASEKIINQEKKILEVFFWFLIKDSTDENILRKMHDGDYVEALEIANSKVSASPNNMLAFKNKAVIESVLFAEKKQIKYLDSSITSWKKIFESEKLWKDFEKIYKLDNPSVSNDLFESLKDRALKKLSDFYSSMSKTLDDEKVYAKFSEKVLGNRIEIADNIIDPILTKINHLISKLNNYKVIYASPYKQDGNEVRDISSTSRKKLSEILKEFDETLGTLQSYGDNVWNSTKSIIMRDKAAMAMRSKAIELSNNINYRDSDDKGVVNDYLELAYNSCSDGSMAEKKLAKDKKDFDEIEENIEKLDVFKKKMENVNYYIEHKMFSQAISEIDKMLYDESIPFDVRARLATIRDNCGAAKQKENSDTIWGIIWAIIIFIIFMVLFGKR